MAPDDRRRPAPRDPKTERAPRSPVAPPQGPEASPPPREVGRDPARGDLLGEPSDDPVTGPDLEPDRT